MSINLFEGARRIRLLLVGLVVLIGLWAIVFAADGYIPQPTFETTGPSVPFKLVADDGCSGDKDEPRPVNGYHYRDGTISDVGLCFRATLLKTGTYEVLSSDNPFDLFGGNDPAAIDQYIAKRTASFRMTPDQEKAVETERNREWWRQRKEWWISVIELTLGVLVTLWVIGFAMGWIVRGFAGIPKGMDTRPVEP